MKITQTRLPNKLTVMTNYAPEAHAVSFGFWIGVGSVYENAQNNGAAHFFEHMAFKGTKRRTALDIVLDIEKLGGYINAYTAREVTAYYGKVLTADTPVLVDVLSDMLQNSTLDSKEMDLERTVILQELMQSIDTPDDIIFDYFQKQMFGEHSLGRPILGSQETITQMSPDSLRGFVKEFYGPSHMVAVASGNVDHDQIVECVSANFLLESSVASYDCPEPVYQGGAHYYNRAGMKQAQLVWGCAAPCIEGDMADAWMFTNVLLSGGMSSRLVYEVREKQGLVYTISSFYSAFQKTGMWGVYAGTSVEKVKNVLEITIQQLQDIAQNGPTDQEMEQAKKQIYAQSFMRWESSSNRARAIAEYYIHTGQTLDSNKRVQSLCATTKAEVQAVVQKILSSAGTCVVLSSQQEHMPSDKDWALWGVQMG